MKNCVYRFIDCDNNIIYIGKAKNLNNRLCKNRHRGEGHLPKVAYDSVIKVEYTQFNNRNDVSDAEKYYINKFNPKYNYNYTDLDEIDNNSNLDSKEWHIFWEGNIEEKQFEELISRYGKNKYIIFQSNIKLKDYILIRALKNNSKIDGYKSFLKDNIDKDYIERYLDWNTDIMDEIILKERLIYNEINSIKESLSYEFKHLNIYFDYRVDDSKEVDTIEEAKFLMQHEYDIGRNLFYITCDVSGKTTYFNEVLSVLIKCK